MRIPALIVAVGLVLSPAALAPVALAQSRPTIPNIPHGEPGAQQAWEVAQQAYLEWQATQPGWEKTATGLFMRRTSEAHGGNKPRATSEVTINYEGKLIDGTIFDSTFRRGQPASFPLPDLIKAWKEAIPMMHRSETWELVVPAALGYQDRVKANIPPNSTLLFKIQLVDYENK